MGLIARLFHTGQTADPPDLQAAIERAVYLVEPRLKLAGGFPARYRKPVAHALAYCRSLAAQVPGPIVVDRKSYASDPLVHALFPSLHEVRAAMCISQAMRDFHKSFPAAVEVYALMGMRRQEKKMFGMEMQGETLKRDVSQHLVYFSDHTLADPAPTEAEARERVMWGLFDSLMAHVTRRVAARQQERAALEQEKDELLARMRGASAATRAELEPRWQELLVRLQAIHQELDLRQYGEDFDAVLLQPEAHLYLQQTAMYLDNMGIHRGESSGESSGEKLQFCDLIGRDRRAWTVVMVHCSNLQSDATLSERLETGQRWLGG